MDISRNQFFFAGFLCLLLGGEFRMVDSIELTPKFTQFLAERTGHPLASVGAATQTLTQSEESSAKKVITHPIGSVGLWSPWGACWPCTVAV